MDDVGSLIEPHPGDLGGHVKSTGDDLEAQTLALSKDRKNPKKTSTLNQRQTSTNLKRSRSIKNRRSSGIDSPNLLPSGKTPRRAPDSDAERDTHKLGKKAPPSWTFPKSTLEDAIKIPRALEEQNAGNPMKPDMLSKAVGYNSVSDWRFLELLRSANQYGLVSGSGKISVVSLTEIGRGIVSPSSPIARPIALQKAFRSVEDFRKVEEYYGGKNFLRTNFLKIRFSDSSAFLVIESEYLLMFSRVI